MLNTAKSKENLTEKVKAKTLEVTSLAINLSARFMNIKKLVSVALVTILGVALLNFGIVSAQNGGSSNGFLSPSDNPGRVAAATGGQTSARQLVLTIVNFFLGFLGLLAVLMVIYGGIMVVTSQGDPEKAGKGKKILLYAAAGIVIILLSFAFVNTILGAGTGQDG